MLPGLGRPALNDRGGMSAAGRLPPKALVGAAPAVTAGRRRVQAGAACGSSLRASAVVRSCVGWNEFACAMAQPVWKTWWRNSPRSNSLGVSSGNSADSSRISLEEMRRAM